MSQTILLIGTLDTKGEEFAYVRQLIADNGMHTLVMDTGILSDPAFDADISAEQVAEAGGSSLQALRARRDRGTAVQVMIEGAKQLALQYFEQGRFDGALGLGGGGGTSIAASAMRELPVGVPKLICSTVASGDTSHHVGVKDITMMYSVVDIAGLNRLSRTILANAAGAICGMVGQKAPPAQDKPMVAASMFGVTTPCVTRVRQRIEAAGYEALIFHATGAGGKAMEALIGDGYVRAVADVTTTEWCDEVVGGVLSAGPDRCGAAARSGTPQVVSVGALDMVNFHGFETVPERFRDRNLYRHNPTVTLMRTTADECRQIAQRIAAQLNQATGPTTLMLPLKGVSMIDAAGQPFHDPQADAALFETLRDELTSSVELIEVDAHINDPAFADAIADRLLVMLGQETGTPQSSSA